MEIVNLKSRIGPDGILRINVPTKIREQNVEVLVVFDIQKERYDQNKSIWPENFFTNTFGCLSNDPMKRETQGISRRTSKNGWLEK